MEDHSDSSDAVSMPELMNGVAVSKGNPVVVETQLQ